MKYIFFLDYTDDSKLANLASVWVSMGTSQTIQAGKEVHVKVFKPLINYIQRTF